MSVEQPYLEQRLVAGEWRLGIVDDDGRWLMLRREPRSDELLQRHDAWPVGLRQVRGGPGLDDLRRDRPDVVRIGRHYAGE